MDGLVIFGNTLLCMLRDVLPIAGVLIGFQILVLRQPVKNLARVSTGLVFVLLGLTLFLQGLEIALFPLGRLMAAQLTAPGGCYRRCYRCRTRCVSDRHWHTLTLVHHQWLCPGHDPAE